MPFYTSLTLIFKGKLLRHRVFFPTNIQTTPDKELALFKPQTIICFVREDFRRKKFIPTSLFVIKTVSPGEKAEKIFGVDPGAKMLLLVKGETRIKRTLNFTESLLKRGIVLDQLSDSTFEAIHSRNEAYSSLDLLAERIVEEAKF